MMIGKDRDSETMSSTIETDGSILPTIWHNGQPYGVWPKSCHLNEISLHSRVCNFLCISTKASKIPTQKPTDKLLLKLSQWCY